MESAPGISPDRVCPNCGLPVGQRGSFTYWIFKDNRCQCDDAYSPGLSAGPGPTSLSTNSAAQPDSGSSTGSGTATESANSSEKLILNHRYELLKCVGQGGIGFVYKGRDMSTGQIVALKIMRPELARNELATKRVMREVEVVSGLSNSNLGKVYGYGQEKDGAPYLVMEFIEGRNMEEFLQAEGTFKLERALDMFLQICSGLQGAHANGIIHRDLKPSNVIIDRTPNGQEHATIVDFGFARVLRDANESMKLTQEGEVFGSPAYMSPEQCLGEPLDARSDIYSLGCLMYETLTGVPPLLGENVLATVAKQIRSTAPSMQTHTPSIPTDLDAIVLKCLSKEPLHRYQTVTDLRMDLDRIKRGEPVKGTLKRSPAKAEQSGAERNSLRSSETAYGMMTNMMGIVVVAAVAIGIGSAAVAYMLFSHNNNSATQPPAVQSQLERSNSLIPDSNSTLSPATETTNTTNNTTSHETKDNTDARRAPAIVAVASHHASSSVHSSRRPARQSAGGWDKLKGLRVYK